MRLRDWMALVAFWTISVNGDTARDLPQDNPSVTLPTRYYDTIHENAVVHSIELSLLVAPVGTTANALKTSTSQNEPSSLDYIIHQMPGAVSIESKLLSEVGDTDNPRKLQNSKIIHAKLSEVNNLDGKSFEELPRDSDQSNFDENMRNKIDTGDGKFRPVSPVSETNFQNFPLNPSTPTTRLSMLPMSRKYVQLSRALPTRAFHLKKNENNVVDYASEVITEREITGLIRQESPVQSAISSRGEDFPEEKEVVDLQKIPEDVDPPGGLSPEPIDTRKPSGGGLDALNDVSALGTHSHPKTIIDSPADKDDVRPIQSKGDTFDGVPSKRPANEPKLALSLSAATTASAIRGTTFTPKVTPEAPKESLIPATSRPTIKNDHESECEHANTDIITRTLRDTIKERTSKSNKSRYHEISETPSLAVTKSHASPEFPPPDTKNKLNTNTPPTFPDEWLQFTDAEGTVSESTTDTDSAVPSVLTPEIDKPKNPETYIIKSHEDSSLTTVTSELQDTDSWDYDRYPVKTGKVNTVEDSLSVDRLINETKLLHQRAGRGGPDEITVESSASQITELPESTIPPSPDVSNNLIKFLRSASSDNLTRQSDVIDSGLMASPPAPPASPSIIAVSSPPKIPISSFYEKTTAHVY
ncbi:uncharacterized protein LOC135169167 [Diachasmimorpha longicaudata]|uniref:uncharacterized protein LOC135169167 n=1 Tax=Diachasmimorpha longicaudata TaxID=58733 RepID=UPI0030B8AC2F